MKRLAEFPLTVR